MMRIGYTKSEDALDNSKSYQRFFYYLIAVILLQVTTYLRSNIYAK